MTYHAIGDETARQRRGMYLSDRTWDYWQEVSRRAHLLAEYPRDATADVLIMRALRLLMRQIEREAERRDVDLARPPLDARPRVDDSGESGDGFRQAPRPPSY